MKFLEGWNVSLATSHFLFGTDPDLDLDPGIPYLTEFISIAGAVPTVTISRDRRSWRRVAVSVPTAHVLH